MGYDDTGYDLPKYIVRKHIVEDAITHSDSDGQIKMFADVSQSLQEASREKNSSIAIRVAKAKEIMSEDPSAHFILWHDLEAERNEIKHQIPEAVDIYGAMDYDERERRVIDFPKVGQKYLRRRNHFQDADATFRNIVTVQFLSVSTINFMILFRRYTEFIVFCKLSK